MTGYYSLLFIIFHIRLNWRCFVAVAAIGAVPAEELFLLKNRVASECWYHEWSCEANPDCSVLRNTFNERLGRELEFVVIFLFVM